MRPESDISNENKPKMVRVPERKYVNRVEALTQLKIIELTLETKYPIKSYRIKVPGIDMIEITDLFSEFQANIFKILNSCFE